MVNVEDLVQSLLCIETIDVQEEGENVTDEVEVEDMVLGPWKRGSWGRGMPWQLGRRGPRHSKAELGMVRRQLTRPGHTDYSVYFLRATAHSRRGTWTRDYGGLGSCVVEILSDNASIFFSQRTLLASI